MNMNEKSKKSYSCVVWDWNGTLLDDAWLCVDVLNGMLARRGLSVVTRESYEQNFGFPVIDYYRFVGLHKDGETFENIASEFMDEYERRRLECNLQKGALEVLEGFSKAGARQFVLSAYKHDSLKDAVARYEVAHYFESVSGLDDHYAVSKVENGRKLISQLGVDPAEVLFVGDTLHDFEVANAMGVSCVLIPSGHHSREKLVASGATVVEELGALGTFGSTASNCSGE